MEQNAFSLRIRVRFEEDHYDEELRESFSERIVDSIHKTLYPTIIYEQCPPCPIVLDITVIKNDGCVLSTAITCASLTLYDAGIPQYGLTVATTTCYIRDTCIVNPPCKYANPAIASQSLLLFAYV